ncbi:MAG: catalase family protein [Cyanosarcina radialis HA8281-LM2]|jgi:catalase|nr:catalase family protein [Cyanosarcina radialis HA8281-LM2]
MAEESSPERIPPEEEGLIEQLVQFGKKSMEGSPPMLRDQHPKSHGCVKGKFIVEANIPDDMKVGVFKEPKKIYDVWIRFSNNSNLRTPDGKLQPDTEPDGKGMAIKLMNVEGEKVLDDPEHQGEQDFVLLNSPNFFIRDLQQYINFFMVAAARRAAAAKLIREGKTVTPETPLEIPKDLQEPAKDLKENKVFERVMKIRMSASANSQTNPLEITYWSSTPYKLGDRAMKFSAVPIFTGEKFDPEKASNKDNYFREAMRKQLSEGEAVFDFKIQLQKDAIKMPIEDSTVEWDEKESPFFKVATIRIPSQEFDTPTMNDFDEKLAFSPWNTLPELQPLGGVNRSRKRIYQELARLRNQTDRAK